MPATTPAEWLALAAVALVVLVRGLAEVMVRVRATRAWVVPAVLATGFAVTAGVAFALAEPDPARQRRTYWLTGAAVFLTWVPSVAIGGVLGQVIGDPNRLGLDAATLLRGSFRTS